MTDARDLAVGAQQHGTKGNTKLGGGGSENLAGILEIDAESIAYAFHLAAKPVDGGAELGHQACPGIELHHYGQFAQAGNGVSCR